MASSSDGFEDFLRFDEICNPGELSNPPSAAIGEPFLLTARVPLTDGFLQPTHRTPSPPSMLLSTTQWKLLLPRLLPPPPSQLSPTNHSTIGAPNHTVDRLFDYPPCAHCATKDGNTHDSMWQCPVVICRMRYEPAKTKKEMALRFAKVCGSIAQELAQIQLAERSGW